ncbi:MAG: hypothetical protein AB8G05_00370 [Oligoflexales bacterium]
MGSNSLFKTDLLPQIAVDNSWSASQGIGKFYSGIYNNRGKSLSGGGRWVAGSSAGIFSALTHFFQDQGNEKVGFRCTVEIPQLDILRVDMPSSAYFGLVI